jgi:NAD(P)-dependent dehydrogenase (short-subunit alcohol dehydrogenase family)
MAEEGADIIAIDICRNIDSNPYPLATPDDLSETERLIKETGRRVLARQADVRERDQLRDAVDAGVTDFGGLDIVVCNAGICPMAPAPADPHDFVDATDVDLLGVMNAVAVSLRHIHDHGSIVITGSTAGMMAGTVSNPRMGPGGDGYGWSKKILQEYTEHMAIHLAGRFIRVNCIHPTNCNTHLLHHPDLYQVFRPDLENPTLEDVLPAFTYFQAMPIPYVEPVDIANLAVFLSSEEGRYITGQQIRVDAGALLKFPNGPTG